jgi:P27 family predicted phage terminase small subunit
MIRGPKPKPTALRRMQGNPGKRGYNHEEPEPPEGLPSCPEHLNPAARDEWDRLANVLHEMGVVTLVDRAALAAYCQCYGRWVEAEEKLRATPILLKTATGYVQQSPWLSIANKQLELMGRYMAELGLTPASRSRVAALSNQEPLDIVTKVEFVTVYEDAEGNRHERALSDCRPVEAVDQSADQEGSVRRIYLDGRL